MLAIEVEFLMGRSVAADFSDRSLAEWPPHPQRFFSALVAAQEELELGADCEAALRWLEKLPAPAISADPMAVPRQVRPHFVPVNDSVIDNKALSQGNDRLDPWSLRGAKSRQLRYFPAMVPNPPRISYLWDKATPSGTIRGALDQLLAEISYLGHSSTPVRASRVEEPDAPVWRPDPRGEEQFRVPGPGRLDRLRDIHALRIHNESIEIPLGRFENYSTATPIAQSIFKPTQALAITGGPQPGVTLGLEATIPIMQRLRAALLKLLEEPIPEVLSGHDANGRPTREPHLAIMPLAHVGGRFGDGSVKGFGFVLPQDCSLEADRRLAQALDGLAELKIGALGVLRLRPVAPGDILWALNLRRRYACSGRHWSSVTPVVLDRHPKASYPLARIVAKSCKRIGLPESAITYAGDQSQVNGSPSATAYIKALRHLRSIGQKEPSALSGRIWRHMTLEFPEPVRGPVLLGAGRFLGYGLFAPVQEGEH